MKNDSKLEPGKLFLTHSFSPVASNTSLNAHEVFLFLID